MEPDVSVEEDEVDDDGEEQPATAREASRRARSTHARRAPGA
jgi:hypothetical protein